ncbi:MULTISPECIES: shikimate dehydrogenase [unclassified Bradyrhizobium]|uniref:shikimate dehydrogenase family protein n=1 Tax=unclassified Bradyrhizobium TaxID=2631580 RepID=UPI0020122BAF|nr:MULTISPECIES: shikimate dehydrogenase [unclassified Bradyrhizobium]
MTMSSLNGNTLIFGTVADPVAHVTSPWRFDALFREWSVNAVMLAFHVRPDNLGTFLTGARVLENLKGFCVTVPHKMAVVPLLDEVTPRATRVGAVNVVRREPDGRLIGDQLDGLGFVEGLRAQGHDPRGKRIFIAGAGGAAAGIVFGLAEAGAARITIYNRTAARAEELAARVRATFPTCDIGTGNASPTGHDIAINGTSAGLKADDPLPFDIAGVTPQMVVAEVIMTPRDTPLLKAAAARGAPIHYGDAMLLSQLPLLAEFMGARRAPA